MSTVMQSVPYIHFTNNCAEAMAFYQQCLGGELTINKVGDTPMAEQMQGMEEMVMHSQLVGDGWAVFASDWCAPTERREGNNFSVMLECADEASQTQMYDKLSAGGTQSMPLSDTFWGARFGMLKDKFGVDWMLNLTKK